MPTNDIYEVRLEGVTCEAERWNIVTHFVLGDNESTSLYETSGGLAFMAATQFGTLFLPIMPIASSFTGARVNRIWPSIGIAAESSAQAGNGAIDDDDPLPADIAAVLTKRSDFPGKSGRGRMYYGNLIEEQQNGGILGSSDASLLAGKWTQWAVELQEDENNNVWGFVIFSPKLASEEDPTPYHAVARIECDRVLRRMAPRGSAIAQRVGPAE